MAIGQTKDIFAKIEPLTVGEDHRSILPSKRSPSLSCKAEKKAYETTIGLTGAFQCFDSDFEVGKALLHAIDILVQYRDLAFGDARLAHVVNCAADHSDILHYHGEIAPLRCDFAVKGRNLAVEGRKRVLNPLKNWQHNIVGHDAPKIIREVPNSNLPLTVQSNPAPAWS